jgi:polyhydroxybutyrate depolymerase
MNRRPIVHSALAGLVALLSACTGTTPDDGAGTAGAGGVPAGGSGGKSALGGGSGMSTGSAGTLAGMQGGSAGSGASGGGGSAGSIGVSGGGGASAAGRGGTGGAIEGAGTGGTGAGTGGRPAGAGGTAGASAGGAGRSGGSGGQSDQPAPTDPVPSMGCGASTTPDPCDTQSAPCTADIDGTMRKWWVQLPDSYDPTHPYPVVFEYHPLGGNGWQGLTMYQIRPKMPAAIYVSPEGTGSGNLGFPNTNGMDEALTRKMMADLEAQYCVDKARYYATGFSYGGSMSYTAACNMSDVFRAIGAQSGAPISGAKCTTKQPERPVAVWATHGDMDTALPITMAQPIIDSLAKYNGCTTETKPVDPSPCVEYQGCKAGYPVVWCVRPGDPHAIPSFGSASIAKFFQQF